MSDIKPRKHFNEEIIDTKRALIIMFEEVYRALETSYNCLLNVDMDTALDLINADEAINKKELEIEDLCAVIIATEYPVAGDLRFFLNVVQTTNRLERIGDHAVHNAKNAIRLAKSDNPDFAKDDIQDISQVVLTMMRDAIDAYKKEDIEIARKVIDTDKIVNEKHENYMDKIRNEMSASELHNEDLITHVFISRFLERTADHIKNTCKGLIFAITGEHIKKTT